MSALAVAIRPADREMDDLDLVAAVRAGDDRAFDALFRRYQPQIVAFVGRRVRDRERAEDITQEVFMSALRCLREDHAREIRFRPWIYAIAKNKCIDAHRRAAHTTMVSFDAHDELGAAEHARLAQPAATPETAVEGKADFDNLRGAFGDLSPVHRDILVMREFDGLSSREIGDRLGMSSSAVDAMLARARKHLGEEYEELDSGQRCLDVQRIVADAGLSVAGLREQRRVRRHLAHCQSCRLHAHLAGADKLVRPSTPARVAAFLPLPAFLRRLWGGGDVGHVLSQQATRPAAQWASHVAGTVDPGTMSTWAKVAVTAATVAIAGGTTIAHRAPDVGSPPPAAAASAPHESGVENALSAAGNRTPSGSPAAPTAAAQPDAAAAGTPPPGDVAGSTAGAKNEPAGPRAGSGGGSSPADGQIRDVDPQPAPGGLPQAPLDSGVGAPQITGAPAVGGVGDTAPGGAPPRASATDAAGPVEPGRRLGAVGAPAHGATAEPDRVVPNGALGGATPASGNARGTAPVPGVVPRPREPRDDPSTAARDAAPTARAESLLSRVPGARTTPIAAPTSLGG